MVGNCVDQTQTDLAPDALLASWKVDLTSLFNPDLRFQDIAKSFWAEGPPPDDPATPWSELQVYFWLNLYPGYILPTCEDGFIPPQGVCVKKQMDDAWDAYQKAQDNLDLVQLQAAKALYSAESTVSKAKDSLATAEGALADLKAGPDLLEVDVKEKQLAVAQASLASAEEDLADLKAGPDLLEVDVKEKQLAVAQASLVSAEEALAKLNGDVDALEVALKENDVASAQTALATAIQRLEGITLTASSAGVVSLVNVVTGQAVTATTTVVEIVDPTVVELNGIVNEIDVLSVRLGDRADVTMDALPGQVLQGTVSTIASAAQSQQGVVSYPISIQLQVPQGVQLREGLSATASIIIREENNVLRVPLQALYGTFDKPVVKVMNSGRTEDRPVVLGNSDDYWVAVRQGLAEGEQVVMQTQLATTSQFGPGNAFRQSQGGLPGIITSDSGLPGIITSDSGGQGTGGGTRTPQSTPRTGGQGTGGGTRIPRQTPQPGGEKGLD
ncbi:MAG: efflux RND transporter periplasmic adaptor subunit [Chloroflexi bacterium]|nr:efflux RND transporter periplasmic adaptor subunit [Chloroflexota bacterium]